MLATITHVGTATFLLEVGGLRIVTDPVLGPTGRAYRLGPTVVGALYQYASRLSPVLPPGGIGRVDLALLSHDQHRDNLDDAGLAVLSRAARILTTPSGARRLRRGGLANAEGLLTWAAVLVETPAGPPVKVTAAPARHGPPFTRALTGEVTGFVLEWAGQPDGALYISGDTVWYRQLPQIGRRVRIGTALLHLGAARFGHLLRPRFSLNAEEAVAVARHLGPRQVIPAHYEGWTHFTEGREQVETAFARAGLESRLRWLERGVPAPLTPWP